MALFAFAPVFIAWAPYESTMGLVQKIFYFHVPSWFVMFTSVFVCGVASVIYLIRNEPKADRVAQAAAELAVLFGFMGLVTGPLWWRKAWGVWWQWDARLTMALMLQMIFIAYLLLRKFAGPGTEKLSAALALFGTAVVPFVYVSVNVWRTIHPQTTVIFGGVTREGEAMPPLVTGMAAPFWFSVLSFMLLYLALLTLRIRLEDQQATLEQLYLEIDERG